MRKRSALLLPLCFAACANQTPYATTIGALAPNSTMTVRLARGALNAYHPAAGEPSNRFTVAATARKGTSPAGSAVARGGRRSHGRRRIAGRSVGPRSRRREPGRGRPRGRRAGDRRHGQRPDRVGRGNVLGDAARIRSKRRREGKSFGSDGIDRLARDVTFLDRTRRHGSLDSRQRIVSGALAHGQRNDLHRLQSSRNVAGTSETIDGAVNGGGPTASTSRRRPANSAAAVTSAAVTARLREL